MEKGHLFFDYFDNLKEVDLRYLHGSQLAPKYFRKWLEKYPDPYGQRYRKSIPYSFVKKTGKLLMTLKDGEVVYPSLVKEIPAASIEPEATELDQPED
jgi:hypothetical protein